jgi:hypothetical protein
MATISEARAEVTVRGTRTDVSRQELLKNFSWNFPSLLQREISQFPGLDVNIISTRYLVMFGRATLTNVTWMTEK